MAQSCMPCGSVSVIELCSIKPPEDPPDTLVSPTVVSNTKQKNYEIWSFYQKTCVNINTSSTLAQSTETPTTPTDQPSPTTESYRTSTLFNISSSFPPIGGDQGVSSATANPVLIAVVVSLLVLALCIIIVIVLCVKFKPDLLRKMRLPFQQKRGQEDFYHIKNRDESENGPKSPGAESVCSTSPLQENTENHDNFHEDGRNSGFVVDVIMNSETECVGANSSSVFFANKITTKDETVYNNIDNNNYHTTVNNSLDLIPLQCTDINGDQDIRLETLSTSESVKTGSEYKINEQESHDMLQDQWNKAPESDLVPEGSIENSEVKSEGKNNVLQPEAVELVVPDDNNTLNNSLINNKLSHPVTDTENMTVNGDYDGDSRSKFSNDGSIDDKDGNCNKVLNNLASEDGSLETKTNFKSTKLMLELPDGLPSMDKLAHIPVESFGDSGYASRQMSRQEST